MDTCLKCGMRNDDWFLCNENNCPAKLTSTLEAENARLRADVDRLTTSMEPDELEKQIARAFLAEELLAAAEARVAVLEKALRVARGCIWFGGDTISALKKIDAALTPIKENDHAE